MQTQKNPAHDAPTSSPSAILFRPVRPASDLARDRQLVDRLVADDADAWRELNARYAAGLHRAIGRVLARFSSVTSSDDVREVYAKLCVSLLAKDKLKLRSYDPTRGARLGSWLTRLAMQASYDHLRRIKRSPVDGRYELFDVPSDETDPFDACWERERAQLIAGVLGKLSVREREFFQLYFGEGLEPERIAERMGISVATVYTKRYKLERRLQALLQEQRLAA